MIPLFALKSWCRLGQWDNEEGERKKGKQDERRRRVQRRQEGKNILKQRAKEKKREQTMMISVRKKEQNLGGSGVSPGKEERKQLSPKLIFCFLCSNVFTLCCQRVIIQSLARDWLAKNASLISGLIFTPSSPSAVTFLPCAQAEKEREESSRVPCQRTDILNQKWARQATLPPSWQGPGTSLAASDGLYNPSRKVQCVPFLLSLKTAFSFSLLGLFSHSARLFHQPGGPWHHTTFTGMGPAWKGFVGIS